MKPTNAPPLNGPKQRLRGAVLFCLSLLMAVSGCTFLPSAGPSDYTIRKGAGKVAADGTSYQLLMVNGTTLDAIRRFSSGPTYVAAGGRDVMQLFRNRGIEALGHGNAQAIRPGDVVQVAIFEAGGGLFKPMPIDESGGGTPVTALPAQPIDAGGEITIPYAGRVKALGRVPGDLEKEITGLLAGKTVDPQVIVTVMKREGGDLVSVGGDVRTSRQVPVTLAGTRLIDAITAAGGPTTRPHEVVVSVARNGVTRSDTLQSIFDNPKKNILLQPADTVLLRNVPVGYMVFGAGGTVGSVPIDVEDLSLAQAMARTGGANDMRANPSAVFIYRAEDRRVLGALGKGAKLPGGDGPVPVIYQLRLQEPRGFFYASHFKVRDQDILYYPNATSVGVGKFMGLLNTLLSPVSSVAGGASTVRILAPGAIQ
jgi:polysaccharide export outer membrane protein